MRQAARNRQAEAEPAFPAIERATLSNGIPVALARRTAVFATYGPRGRRLACWLMPVAALCDAAENALHAWLTEVPRFGLEPVYALAGTVSLTKWLLLMAFAAAVAPPASVPKPPRMTLKIERFMPLHMM